MNYFKIGHLYKEISSNTILLITQEMDELNNTSAEAIIVCSNLPLYSFRRHNGNRIFIDDDVERYYFKNIMPE